MISLEYDSNTNRTLLEMFIKFDEKDPFFYNKYTLIN